MEVGDVEGWIVAPEGVSLELLKPVNVTLHGKRASPGVIKHGGRAGTVQSTTGGLLNELPYSRNRSSGAILINISTMSSMTEGNTLDKSFFFSFYHT